VHLGVTVPADAKPSEPVKVGEGPLHHPALAPEAGAVGGAPAGDDRSDAAPAHQAAVLVVVVGAVAEHLYGAPSGPAEAATERAHRVDQGHQLGDIVAVAAGERHRQRDPRGLDQQVVLGAQTGAIDRARAAQEPPKTARTWLESTAARDQSIWPAAFRRTSRRW
jgi:hypothetical protein